MVTDQAEPRPTFIGGTMNHLKVIIACFGFAFAIAVAFAFGSGGAKKTSVNGIGWYASFDDALGQAKRTGKPILFFSMFGKLDEEMPCANARTLRATLFTDPEFKKLVTNDVIPAWEMVRAVPRVTIDLGDGKKIQRTVRGNAVMYLCNSDGRVIDAFPGIYTAQDFMPMIRESIAQLAKADYSVVAEYHRARGAMIPRTRTTGGKAALEGPTLNMIGARQISGATITEKPESPERQRFLNAARMLSDLSLIPMTPDEAARAVTGAGIQGRDPKQLAQDILNSDSKNNMTRVRPVIHLWLASEKSLPTPAQARDTVLETILKIPYKDPYFGLKDVLLPGTPN